MAKTYKDYKKILKDKLTALVDNDTPTPHTLFAAVYDYEETQPSGFPCAYVIADSGSGSILDTARNEREWQFRIILRQEISKVGRTPEEAEDILTDMVDYVINAFDTDPQLYDSGGLAQCMYCKVVPVEFNFNLSETAQVFAILQVSIVHLVNNF